MERLSVFGSSSRYDRFLLSWGLHKKTSLPLSIPAFQLRYLEPWHADVYDFIELRKNHGKEEQRARDLFLGLWIPDLFMKRVKQNEEPRVDYG